MAAFLQDIVRIPSLSTHERRAILAEEMRRLSAGRIALAMSSAASGGSGINMSSGERREDAVQRTWTLCGRPGALGLDPMVSSDGILYGRGLVT
jgi:hypothetical protein